MDGQPSQAMHGALPVLEPNAAGLDLGSVEIWACVPADRDAAPVRRFGTCTPDLQELATWLLQCGVTSVAMEATGIYWVPVFEVLEARGLQVWVINPHQLKHVPGRKSDVKDCQWIQRLHTFGLLSNSFQPAADMRALRSYLRQRAMLLEHRAAHVQHMQKALQQMNVQVGQAVKDITGQTGLAMIRDIVAGERDPARLAAHRHPRCLKTPSEMVKALSGNFQAEHVFALKQALALYDAYTAQVQECDRIIEQQWQAVPPQTEDDLPPPAARNKPDPHSKNGPAYDARSLLYKATGVDLCAIPGLGATTVQVILAEIGGSVTAWPTAKQFCAWLALAPQHEISGGKVLHKGVAKTGNRAGQAFRVAAQTLLRSPDKPLGAFSRRARAKWGPERAIIATAHKLARIFYTMLKTGIPFDEQRAIVDDERQRQRKLKYLEREAAKYGCTLTPFSVNAPVIS
jgi:transposase